MWIFGKNTGKKQAKADYSITDLSLEQKEDVLVMYKQGIKPSDIAEEMGIAASKVAKVIELDRRKQGYQAMRGQETQPPQDPIQQMNIEIKKLELEQKRLELQWALEDKKEERKADLMGDQEESGTITPQDAIMQGFLMKMIGGGASDPGIPPQNPHITGTIPGSLAPPQNTPRNSIDLTEAEISEIIEQYPKEAKKLRKMPDTVIKKAIKDQFPMISDKSADLALSILKKKEIKT